ncbi:DUF6636 domain-containing protein [Rhodococcus gannanensis]|uniref:DUF6636 domain-containing protein n=1 Tax=Rhodococcus gannanensis TaxID=1960308 RepID=A0ABW4PBJ7_9NOCA
MVLRRVVMVAGAAVAALAVAGCGSSDTPEAATVGVVSGPVSSTSVPTTPAPAAPTTSATAAPTTSAAATTTYQRNEAVYFTAPNGGFQCGIIELPTRVEAGCQGPTDPIPPRPDNCMIAWGTGIRVTTAGPAEFLCAGGVVYTSGEDDPVLPVGQSVASFGFTCTSTHVGASCRNDESGHGFEIGPDSNETF